MSEPITATESGDTPQGVTTSEPTPSPNGPAWAAIVAAALGGLAFGGITDVSECWPLAAGYLQWYRPAGALSGVAISSVAIWILLWAALHALWRHRQIKWEGALLALTILAVLVALVSTFPPFYELFGG